MSTAVLELNDQALLIKTQAGEVYSEPGFALHTEQGIITGLPARQQAWLQPQNIYREYWRQLNQAPLSGDQQWARHHADIAYAQLHSLLTKAGTPEQLVLCVPSTFDDQQLSLLLGLIDAINTTVVSVIDSSLANCLYLEDYIENLQTIQAAEKQTLHIDLQMHQMVVSQISFERNSLRIEAHQVIPDLGASHIFNALAGYIRDLAIKTHRFDPLHTSEGEQAIYDQLPSLVARFGGISECDLSLSSPRGDLPMLLRKSEIEALLEPRLQSLTRLISNSAAADITLSHNTKLIPALHSGFSHARQLNETQAVDNCLRSYDSLLKHSENLHRITSFEQKVTYSGRRKTDIAPPKPATHLLYQGRAWPLNEPLSIGIDGKRLNITQLVDSSAALVVSINNHSLNILYRDNQISIELPESAAPGGKIFIGDFRLQLIEVCNG
ncbi:MAG: hypothetical protein P8H31_05645 [Porticoccaceae bacterium]|nr:hypothetical protein [Porticoccaceae bacterium]